MPTIHEIEPELLSRTPRRIKRNTDTSDPTKMSLEMTQVILIPFIIVGIGIMLPLLHYLLLTYMGVNAPAVITSKKAGQTYTTNFTYTYKGISYPDSSELSHDVYDKIETGQKVRVKILPIVPYQWPLLSNPPGKYQKGNLTSILIANLLWNGMMGFLILAYFVCPFFTRHIYKQGTPAIATIIGKNMSTGEGNTDYSITYEFTHIDGRPTRIVSSANGISEACWEKIVNGDQCTALYLANRPQMSVLYLYDGYRVIG